MILSIDDVLREIHKYDDSYDLASALEVGSGSDALTQEVDACTRKNAAGNLRGMYELLRSARHHLAVKALDSA